tara:strand:- start:95 stop:1378 length:1284 start_codon:yes stop_codon:yes gene_type:complete
MKKINSFIIDKSDLAATALSRQYTVNGEKDAEFILQVFDTPSGSSDPVAFYDFATKSFSTTSTSTSNLSIKMKSASFIGSINFPANGSGDTYTILLLTPPNKDTELSFGQGKNSYSTTITQLANAVLTFTPSSITPLNYHASIPTTTSTASPTSTVAVAKEISWDIINKKDDSYGYGLRLQRQPIDTDWYFTTKLATYTIDGAVAPSDVNSGLKVIVDNLTDLCTGMYITAVAGGSSLSGTPTIIAINISTKTLTMSSAQTFTNGHTLTFEARGSNVIKKAIGIDLDFSNWNPDVDTMTLSKQFKKKVRATGTNAIIALDNTYGITGGSHFRIKGVNVNNNGTNKVLNVATADADGSGGDGRITVQLNQTAALSVGTVLKFFGSGLGKGSRDQLKANNKVIINSNPSSTRTIYLNLDNFITIGVSGL